MDRIITFDVCSIFIDLILIFSLMLRKMTKEKANRVFLLLCCVVFLSAVFDTIRLVIPSFFPADTKIYVLLVICTNLYFLFRELTAPVFLIFIFAVTGRWYEFKKNIKYRLIVFISIFLLFILLIVNIFVPVVFEISKNLTYNRSKYIYLSFVLCILVMFFATIFLIKNKKMLKNDKFWILFLMFPLSVLGIVIQSLNQKIVVEVFTSSVPLLIIGLLVLKPEDVIDFYTGVFNLVACERIIKQNFIARRKMKIVFFKILNDKTLQRQYGDEAYHVLIQNIVKFIYGLNQILEADIFHLENGIFLIETLEIDDNKISSYLNELTVFLKKDHVVGDSLIRFDYLIDVARCPQDFNEYDQILNFGLRFDQIITKKNQVTYYAQEASDRFFILQSNLDEIIKNAILENHFQMYYQPIYSVAEKRFTSAEALIRLVDERYGFIPPKFFISVAENSGAIHQIGDFIFKDVCRFISENNLEKLGLNCIHINLSSIQCIEQELVSKFKDVLDTYSVSSSKIDIEIRENIPDDDTELIDSNIYRLSELGFTFSLDDFGSGYSNLGRMRKLPVTTIKLDKIYVDGKHFRNMEIVIKNTVSMLKKLNKKVLIEGVESQEDYDAFVDYGCDYIQGYYFSKPLPEQEFLSYMKRKNRGLYD